MSLINQALRKAQRERTPTRMSQPGQQGPGAYAGSAASGLSPKLVIGLVIAVAVLVGLVAGLSIVIFTQDSSPSSETALPPSAPSEPESIIQEPTSLTSSPIDPQITPPASISPIIARDPGSSVVDELRKAREAAEAAAASQAQAEAEQAAAEAKAREEAAARAAAQPSKEIISWLGAAKLSGVRISASGNKAILNGNAFSVGEYVNFKLGLKIMLIQEERVLFIDNNGKKYMKRL